MTISAERKELILSHAPIPVLDKGFVRLVDFMGDDRAIVQAARVSTGRGFVSWDPYKRCTRCDRVAFNGSTITNITNDCVPGTQEDNLVSDHDWAAFPRGDKGIVEYLLKNRHTTPFEMVEIKLHIKMPMDAWRQHIRHRMANVNEYSTRYSKAIDDMQETAPDKWRTQGVTNRQGSGAYLKRDAEIQAKGGDYLTERETQLHQLARAVYEERLAMGVAKEQARKDLPLSNYTEAYWKCDLHNLLHFLGLRMHGHAQEEIRSYANAIGEIVDAITPVAYAAWEEHVFHAMRFSRTETALLRDVMQRAEKEQPWSMALKALLTKLGG